VTRYVVTRPYRDSNVGSNLASLAGALWLARRLGRELIVDWRGMSQLQDKSLNYFPELFEHPDSMLGVRVLYAPVAGVDYGDVRPTGGGHATAFATGYLDAPDEPIVLEMYHGPDRIVPGEERGRFELLRSFYRLLAPGAEVRSAVAEGESRLDAAFVVALNVRTGNGRYFGKGGEYAGRVDVALFEDESRFLRVVHRASVARTRGLPRYLRGSPRIFFATDSEQMSRLLSRLPNSTTRRTLFPPAGAGDLHAFPEEVGADRRSVVDTLADMFLLARCDALVYNTSVFNQYARVVTGCFGGNMVHLETEFVERRLAFLRARVEARARRLLPARPSD